VRHSVSRKQHDFVAPFGERDKQRQQHRADQQPVADLDVNRHRSGDRAQHESNRQRQHVDNDDVLQRAGVERLQRDVAERHGRKPFTEERCCHQRRQADRDRRQDSGANRQCARGDRPARFERVPAVGFAVGDVVNQVDDSRQSAEQAERQHRVGNRARVKQLLAEQQARKNQEVLRPLTGTKRKQQAYDCRASRHRRGGGAGNRHG
jgi:two-component sensor histidine kinase